MTRMKFANIIFENTPLKKKCPGLYCKSAAQPSFDATTNNWVLEAGTYDFTTYFNSLPVEKLRRYTTFTGAYLHLEVKGAAVSFVQTAACASSKSPRALEGTRVKLCGATERFQEVDIKLHIEEKDVLAGFILETSGAAQLGNCYYTLEVEGNLRNVDLCLCTTTYKKEEYVKRNIELVKQEILGCTEPISSHFTMHVVDNGSTLNVGELQSKGVHIHPNKNVGGAGGFAYGMLLASGQAGCTHVLLMDDDVVVSPESIKRTFNILRIVNSEYEGAFISGGMLVAQNPSVLWEDAGYINAEGGCTSIYGQLEPEEKYNMTNFSNMVKTANFKPPAKIRTSQRYAAWWYCCIPIKYVHEKGLPLPVFMRLDDAEYGCRCTPGFITMNGICVWHDSFEGRYNPVAERYLSVRNGFIASFTTGFAPKANFLKMLDYIIHLELRKFCYASASLALDGFEDFLAGPAHYSKAGFAEAAFKQAGRRAEKPVPYAQLEVQAKEVGIEGLKLDGITEKDIKYTDNRSIVERVLDRATNNFQSFVVREGSGCALVSIDGWAYANAEVRDKKYIIALDTNKKRGVLRVRNKHKYDEIMKRYNEDLAYFKANKDKLKADYLKSANTITSAQFWKDYLGI